MNPALHSEADRVWRATRPVLRRRRLVRRSALGATLALALAAGALLTMTMTPGDPARTPLATPGQPALEPPAPSLAVLVMDPAGARFAQLSPGELAHEGLTFELTLEPVFTDQTGLFVY